MARLFSSRIDGLLSCMGYGSRNQMARMAKAGRITMDGAAITDVTKRIAVRGGPVGRRALDI